MTLSVLICSLTSRAAQLEKLLNNLMAQSGDLETVEILTNIDNRQKSTGKKRQELLEAATGEYIIFIDDDDEVPDYYIKELLEAAKSGADCFAINGYMTTNGQNKIKWRLSKNYQNVTIREQGRMVFLRTTNHITAVKRELALKAGFPDISNAEDKAYSLAVNPFLKTEFVIKPSMYHYKFETFNKQYL